MSRTCDLTGKKPLTGNNVSNSNRKTKRKFYPNLKLKRLYLSEKGQWVKLKVSTSALKTIDKNGLHAVLFKYLKKGHI